MGKDSKCCELYMQQGYTVGRGFKIVIVDAYIGRFICSHTIHSLIRIPLLDSHNYPDKERAYLNPIL